MHMEHYIILIICSQLYKNKKYGKITVWKTICNFFGSCVNRNPPQLIIDKMTWGKMLRNYHNFWINCGQKKNPQYMNWPPSWLYIMTKHVSTFPVNMQVSYRYRHLPGLYRTCCIPFANTGLVPFQYLHANTYNLQANVFWPGTFWIPVHQYIHTLPVNIFWPDTVLLSAYWYLLLTG